jgi:glutamate-1-semialdehyde 2,1-aminomutase
MEVLRRPGQYDRLREIGTRLQQMQSSALRMMQIPHRISGDPTLYDIYFTENPPRDYRSARHDDPAHNAHYNAMLRANGVLKSPAKLYPSLALTEADLEQTAFAAQQAAAGLAALRLRGFYRRPSNCVTVMPASSSV